jgi:hypothetical protein
VPPHFFNDQKLAHEIKIPAPQLRELRDLCFLDSIFSRNCGSNSACICCAVENNTRDAIAITKATNALSFFIILITSAQIIPLILMNIAVANKNIFAVGVRYVLGKSLFATEITVL